MKAKVKVEVDTFTFVRLAVVVAGFVGVIFGVAKLWPALMLVFMAFFLALALNSPVSAIARLLPRHSRVLATAVSYLFVLSALGIFIYVVVPPIVQQTNAFVESLPSYVDDLGSQQTAVAELINRYDLEDEVQEVVNGGKEQAVGWLQGAGSNVLDGVTSVLSGIVTLLTVLVLTFLMLIEGPMWLQRLRTIYHNPDRLAHHQELLQKMYLVVTRYVNGQLLVAGVAGSVTMITLFVLAQFFPVPTGAVLPLAVLIFLTGLIPMVGATIGAVMVTVVLVFSSLPAAIIFAVFFTVYQQIENNFIQPVVQSRSIELSALAVLVSAIAGINLLGPVGGFVAIPIAGCIRVLLLDYLERRKREHDDKSPKGLLKRLASAD